MDCALAGVSARTAVSNTAVADARAEAFEAGGGTAAGAVGITEGGLSALSDTTRADLYRALLDFCVQEFMNTATIPAKHASSTEVNSAGTLKSPFPK